MGAAAGQCVDETLSPRSFWRAFALAAAAVEDMMAERAGPIAAARWADDDSSSSDGWPDELRGWADRLRRQ